MHARRCHRAIRDRLLYTAYRRIVIYCAQQLDLNANDSLRSQSCLPR
jgi:hypothetical protein